MTFTLEDLQDGGSDEEETHRCDYCKRDLPAQAVRRLPNRLRRCVLCAAEATEGAGP